MKKKLGFLIGTLMIFVTNFFSLVDNATAVQRQSDLLWVWQCKDDLNCSRQISGTVQNGYDTLDECKLVCGAWGALWPRPTGGVFQYSTQLLPLDVSSVGFTSVSDPLLVKMQGLFVKEISLLACGRSTCARCEQCLRLNVEITVFDLTIQSIEWGVDEEYSLQVLRDDSEVRAIITAGTVFGARHGMQTLSQMMVQGTGGGYILVLSSAQVQNDKPKFTHRGVTIDTARHYFPISNLERTIDTMATCKLNTLHLHLTDSHSFPFQSNKIPEMTQWGAYSDAEVYTIQDLEKLSQYAIARGIRIIPELDAPAHAGNGWQWGPLAQLGELAVCVNKQPWKDSCIQPPCGQLNPGNNFVYQILQELYRELQQALSPHANTVFHMGGDEVVVSCWRSSKTVTDWLRSQPGHEQLTDEDFRWAWIYFQTEALKQLDYAYNYTNPSVILWSSHLTDPSTILQTLDPNRYVIQTWVPESETLVQDLINLGYRVIVSNKDSWYLDWGFHGNGLLYSTWKQAYYARVPEGALGGEVALWSELVDELTMDSYLWPRTAAAAERLWSNPPKEEIPNSAESRLLHWRRRNIKVNGIKAASILPQWCEFEEAHCHRPSNVRVNG